MLDSFINAPFSFKENVILLNLISFPLSFKSVPSVKSISSVNVSKSSTGNEPVRAVVSIEPTIVLKDLYSLFFSSICVLISCGNI